MNEINIARTIASMRKEKGLTQEELANFMGVTKASVSKWETGQSYPDIFLLPQLATFFNISLDELLGYEPQMTEDDIRKLYKELAIEFTQQPFDEVMGRCRDITRKYYSCFPLLLQMGVLYLNYGYYTVEGLDEEQKTSVVAEAKEHFIRVKEHSNDMDLQCLATHLIGHSELLLGNPEEVVSLFEGAKGKVPSSNELLLSQAYQMMGKEKEAKTELQRSIYDNIMMLVGIIPSYMALCTEDAAHFEEICRRASEIINLWGVKKLAPAVVVQFYLGAAAGYMAIYKSDKALDMLEEYVELAINDFFPLVIKGDAFFSLVEFDDVPPFGAAEVPRDDNSIKQSLVDGMVNNPAFEALYENPRFKSMANKLTNNLK